LKKKIRQLPVFHVSADSKNYTCHKGKQITEKKEQKAKINMSDLSQGGITASHAATNSL
jgi:hypothetical protein